LSFQDRKTFHVEESRRTQQLQRNLVVWTGAEISATGTQAVSLWKVMLFRHLTEYSALRYGWENNGPQAKCGPPERFQWPAEAFTKIFKSKIPTNSTQQTLVLRLTWTEICFYFQKLWPSADRGLLKMAPEPK